MAQAAAHKFVNEIGAGEVVNGVYVVREPILRSTTRGDLYIAMFLCDRTGQLNARMWQATEAIYKGLPKPGFVHVQGRSELYQNNLQIVVNNVVTVDPSKVDVENYLARTTQGLRPDVQGGQGHRWQHQAPAACRHCPRVSGGRGPDGKLLQRPRRHEAAPRLHRRPAGAHPQHAPRRQEHPAAVPAGAGATWSWPASSCTTWARRRSWPTTWPSPTRTPAS